MDKNRFRILQYKVLVNHKEKLSKLFLLLAVFIIANCESPNPTFTGGSGSPFIAYLNADGTGKTDQPIVFNSTIIDEKNINNIDIRHIFIRNESKQEINNFDYELPFGFRDEDKINNSNIDSTVISCDTKEYLDPNEICRISIRFQPNAKDNFSGGVKITVPNYSFEVTQISGKGLNNTALSILDKRKLKLGFIEKSEEINKTITLVHNRQTLEPISFKLIFENTKVENNEILKVEYLSDIVSTEKCVLAPSEDNEYGTVLEGNLRKDEKCTLSFKITTNTTGKLNTFAYSTIIVKQDSFTDIIPVTGIVIEKGIMSLYSPSVPQRRSSHALSIHKNKLLLIGGAYNSSGSDIQRLNDIWKYNGFSWDNITANYTGTLSHISDTGSVFTTDNKTILIGGKKEGTSLVETVTKLDESSIISTPSTTGSFDPKYSFAHALRDGYMYILGGIDNTHTAIDNDTLRRFNTKTNEFNNVNINNTIDINRALLMASLEDKLYILSDKSKDNEMMDFHILDNLSSNTYRKITDGDNITIPYLGEEMSIMAPSRMDKLKFVARDNASIVSANNAIFVFGGKTSTGATNDMYIYALADHKPMPKKTGFELSKCCAFARDKDCDNTCEPNSPKAFAWATFDNKTDPLPQPRYNAKMQAIGDNIYLFGGVAANNTTMLNDLWKYEIKNYRWVKLVDNNDLKSIENQTAPVITGNNKICTLDTDKKAFYCYDISTNLFKSTEPKVAFPGNISSDAKIAYYENNIYLFQASDTGKINVYNLDNNSWYLRDITPDSDEPTILYNGMTLAVSDNLVYSFEIEGHRVSYTYNLSGTGSIVKTIIVDNSPPAPRTNGEIAIFQNRIYIQGGDNGEDQLDDTWMLDLNNSEGGWTNLTYNKYMSKQASAYKNHSLIVLDGDLYLFSGKTTDGKNQNKVYKFNNNAAAAPSVIIGWEEVTGLAIPTTGLNGDNKFIKLNKNTAIGINGSTIKVLQIPKP